VNVLDVTDDTMAPVKHKQHHGNFHSI